MQYLKQSTTIDLTLGPFLDPTDGVTPETGLTPGIEVSKNGGAFASRNSATAVSHDAEGYYTVELDSTDTNTLGRLEVKAIDSANHLPVFRTFSIVPANVFDSLFSTDKLEVDISNIQNNGLFQVWGYASRGLTDTVNLSSTTETQIDNIETDTNEIQGKLPTNYIMGSSVTTDKDDEIDAIKAKTDQLTFTTSNKVDSRVDSWAGTAVSLSATSGLPEVDAASISDDAIAADNLEAAYDGTGYDIGGIDVSELNQIVDDLINGGRLDLLIDAIKAKTDSLTFTNANKVDATITDATSAGSQEIRNAMSLSSTFGPPDSGSIDDLISTVDSVADTILVDTNEIQGKLPTGDIADESNVETHVTNSLNTYDPPTRTELTSDKNEILAGQSGSGASAAEVWAYGSRGLTDTVNLSSATETQIDNIETVSSLLEGKLPAGAIGDATTSNQTTIEGKIDTIDSEVGAIQTDLSNATDGLGALKTLIDTVDTVVDGIKAVTDALPDSGALNDLATLASRLTAARAGYLDSLNTGVPLTSTTETQIDDIQTSVDSLSVSGASAAEVWAYGSRGLTDTVNLSSATETQIDNIETVSSSLEGKLPAGAIASYSNQTTIEGKIDTIDSNVDTILVDTNEIQSKLPTGDIADESNVETHVTNSLNTYDPPTRTELTADKDEILAGQVTNEITPANIWGYNSRTLTGTVNLSSTTETQIDNIEADTNEIQGKLPTNYIMGSSDQSDLDDDIQGIQTDLSNATDGLGALKTLIDTVDTVVDGIKAVTDALPDSGALNDLATLASRLTAARAGYLDSLNTGVPLTSTTETQIDDIQTSVDSLSVSGASAAEVWAYGSRGLTDTVNLSSATETQIDNIETSTSTMLTTSNKLDDTLELDGAEYRFTTNALEQGPSGTINITSVDIESINGYNVTKNTANNMVSFFDVANTSDIEDIAEMKRMIQSKSG